MKTLYFTVLILFSTACVTKGRYEKVVSSIHSKEKQKVRLEKQLAEVKAVNDHLRDSAERIGR